MRVSCVSTTRWTSAKVYQVHDSFSCSSFPHDWNYSVELLRALRLDCTRELASSIEGEYVRGELVTLPAYSTQLQRQRIIDATEVVSMKLVTLVNDGTACAVKYAMTGYFPTREFHMNYDSSATTTRAPLAAFHTTAVPTINKFAKPESITQTTSLGSGLDTLASETELA
ncbi:hypothetical protein RSOLAG22IIIB_06887 [Rhizoctonia solani]|uniref:Uncharacterized protein n=1 Tax=Rhizoctonia solani TaxID=456999 RepID=A0A0K6GHY1_9AGAM|nr:hypothetical protein RSOLAG22IIIB_06887 [Rhizoctonia solani]